MIAEAIALDGGVLTISAVAGLLVVVAGGAAWAATTRADIRGIAKDVGALVKSVRELGRTLDDHRVEDDARHGDEGRRLDRLELESEMRGDRTPVRGIPLEGRETTGKHDRLRGPTPQPGRRREDTGETGSGFER